MKKYLLVEISRVIEDNSGTKREFVCDTKLKISASVSQEQIIQQLIDLSAEAGNILLTTEKLQEPGEVDVQYS